MGWFITKKKILQTIVWRLAETRIIAIVLVVLTVLLVAFGMLKAYNNHMKAHVKHATKEVVLNNVRTL